MRTIKITVEYDGTDYCGWQIQPNGITIQQKLEEAITNLTGSFARVEGSGRTDSGVHALGQVAHFRTDSNIPANDMARALNAHLPKDISVRHACEVEDGFHARFNATGKIYHYYIENAPTRPVLERRRVWWLTWQLNLDTIRDATARLVGTHDFTSFADAERNKPEHDNTRTIHRAEWLCEGNRLCFVVEGSGFLYKMVRCLVGTLMEVGKGRLEPDEMERILGARDRNAAGPTAPPHGLHLVEVFYPEGS